MTSSPRPSGRMVALAVADDGEAKIVREALGEGYELYPVTTLEELRLLMKNVVPQLCVLDYQLPDGSAFEFCREVRDEPRTRRMSVLVLLPPAGVTLEECFISGVNDFLSRPLDGEEVRRKVERLSHVASRRRLNTLALVKIDGEDSSRLGRALNVSPSGLLVEVDAGLGIGAVCEVRFNLPGQPEPVRARGVVRRRARGVGMEGGGFGIEFATLGVDDRGRLNRFFGESNESGR